MAFQLCKLFSRNKYSGRGFSTFRLSSNHLAYNDWVIFNCNEGRGQISLARSENCVGLGGGWTQWPEGSRRPTGEGPRVTAQGSTCRAWRWGVCVVRMHRHAHARGSPTWRGLGKEVKARRSAGERTAGWMEVAESSCHLLGLENLEHLHWPEKKSQWGEHISMLNGT